VISTVDTEARMCARQLHARQDGFKGHVAVEPHTGLFTGDLRAALAAAGRDAVISRRRYARPYLTG
jgi:hypothetical protein